jgi:spermidine/putrescine transport system ATP-binding protein
VSLIALSGVDKWFGDYQALRSVDLSVAQGEFFSLLGPSGCGKTTLLRTIAGFEAPSAGSLRIDGADMAGVPPNRRPTNMVFQSYAIFPHLSVAENVAFGLRRSGLSRGDRDAKVDEALGMVGLAGFGGRASHALSGGQRQRVALARALVLRPKVLLLDEPLSALDRKLREQMQLELRRLQRSVGITFVLVTHDQEEALILSDRVAVMLDGRIAQLAAPQVLYSRPATREVAEFIGVMSFLPAKATGQGAVEVAGLGRAEIAPDQAPEGIGSGALDAGMRPETLHLLLDGAEPAGRVAEGRIEERAYYGDMTYYEVALPGAPRPVTVSMKNLMGRRVLERGEPARLAWDPRALVVFPAAN